MGGFIIMESDKSGGKSDKSNDKSDKSNDKSEKSNDKSEKSGGKPEKSGGRLDKSNDKPDKNDDKSGDKSGDKLDKSNDKPDKSSGKPEKNDGRLDKGNDKPDKNNDKSGGKPDKKNPKKRNSKKKSFIYTWTFKVIIISFFMTAFFSFVSELTVSASGAVIVVFIILIIIAVGVFFDAISIAVTSCDAGPLTAMASRRVKAAKTALKLVNNADKVASFCGDVVGDILGIISGACIVALAAKAAFGFNAEERLLTIVFSSITAAATIGGKSYFKGIAMKKSKEFVMFAARILCFFEKKDKKERKDNGNNKGKKGAK
jgi:hypothetical protein